MDCARAAEHSNKRMSQPQLRQQASAPDCRLTWTAGSHALKHPRQAVCQGQRQVVDCTFLFMVQILSHSCTVTFLEAPWDRMNSLKADTCIPRLITPCTKMPHCLVASLFEYTHLSGLRTPPAFQYAYDMMSV